jgi:hypothetical protein
MRSMSMQHETENEYDIEKHSTEIYIKHRNDSTLLFFKALARCSAPSFLILLPWIISVSNGCMK